MKKDENFAPGKVIKRIRKVTMKVKELSLQSGISISSIYSIESGRRIPSVEIMERICNTLNYPLFLLLVESINDPASKKVSFFLRAIIKSEIIEKNVYDL